MSAFSKISWTDSTFNPWIGCTKGAPRYRTQTWGDPVKWNQDWVGFQQVDMQDGTRHRGDMKEIAALALDADKIVACGPVRRRVFCASLADWLDDEVPAEWLADLLALIFETPHVDWLLLTKRPQNFNVRLSNLAQFRDVGSPQFLWELKWLNGVPPENVWIGTTVENQEYAERRIPELLKIPAQVRFLSVEPMLGPVHLLSLEAPRSGMSPPARQHVLTQLDWVICGGESGPGRRPFEIEWAESLAAQCATAGVPFFMKQDAHQLSGQQGRIPAALWSLKQFPTTEGIPV